MKNYLKLIRINQWIKNVFVFLPLFFSGNFFQIDLFLQTLFAFFSFSLVASCIYIINDYFDIESDKKHPVKKNRPLASGEISKTKAILILVVMIWLNIGLCFLVKTYFNISISQFIGVILCYVIFNIAYTYKLKHIAIIDVCIIAIGFIFRVLAGGCISEIPVHQWTILLTFVLALVLAIGKRRGELINVPIVDETRKALDGYNVQFADIALSISVTLAIVCYLMFTVTGSVQQQFGQNIFYTVVFVVFAFLRYLQQTLVYNKTESPTEIIYKDRYIQITIIIWIATFLLLIYDKQFLN